MTEDEAFIRTIVDRPGDDLPRLVYADWLDEQDDLRGLYLREEIAWVTAGRPDTGYEANVLNWVSASLDPVWVARVSRPPVGVCVEHISINGNNPRLTVADIHARETHLRFRLPLEYRAFMQNYNGGVTPTAWVPTPENEAGLSLFEFYRLDSLGECRWWEIERPNLRDRPYLGVAHAGRDEWPVMLDIRPQSQGAVYLLDTGADFQLMRLAETLSTVLNLIEPRTDEES